MKAELKQTQTIIIAYKMFKKLYHTWVARLYYI